MVGINISSLDEARNALGTNEIILQQAKYLALILEEQETDTTKTIQKAIKMLQNATCKNNIIEIQEDDIELLESVYFIKKVAKYFEAHCWINADPSGIHLKKGEGHDYIYEKDFPSVQIKIIKKEDKEDIIISKSKQSDDEVAEEIKRKCTLDIPGFTDSTNCCYCSNYAINCGGPSQ